MRPLVVKSARLFYSSQLQQSLQKSPTRSPPSRHRFPPIFSYNRRTISTNVLREYRHLRASVTIQSVNQETRLKIMQINTAFFNKALNSLNPWPGNGLSVGTYLFYCKLHDKLSSWTNAISKAKRGKMQGESFRHLLTFFFVLQSLSLTATCHAQNFLNIRFHTTDTQRKLSKCLGSQIFQIFHIS